MFQFERQFLKSSFPHYCGVPHTDDDKWADLMLRNKLFCAEIDMDAFEDTISIVDEGDCPRERTIVGDFAGPIAVVW